MQYIKEKYGKNNIERVEVEAYKRDEKSQKQIYKSFLMKI